MIKLLLSASLSLALAGCAPAPQKLRGADRRAVKLAYVSDNVAKPAEPYYLGPGGGAGLMFRALGALVSEPGRAARRSSLRGFLDKNDIVIQRIVVEEFNAALRASGQLLLADKPQPGA